MNLSIIMTIMVAMATALAIGIQVVVAVVVGAATTAVIVVTGEVVEMMIKNTIQIKTRNEMYNSNEF
jgi:uncharacterized membrane protein YoaK (UPF0700 family)